MVFDTILRGGTVIDGSGRRRLSRGCRHAGRENCCRREFNGRAGKTHSRCDGAARHTGLSTFTGTRMRRFSVPGLGRRAMSRLDDDRQTAATAVCLLRRAARAYQAEIFDYLTPVTGPLEARMQTDSMGTYLQAAKALLPRERRHAYRRGTIARRRRASACSGWKRSTTGKFTARLSGHWRTVRSACLWGWAMRRSAFMKRRSSWRRSRRFQTTAFHYGPYAPGGKRRGAGT